MRTALFDTVLIALLAAVLIWPLFQAAYFDNWASIEGTFIADGRFLADHWPHPQWQPLWYGGTRFDYIYPPGIRYGTAALVKAAALTPVRAYHVFTALLYAIGIAGVYVLIRAGSGSRGGAWLGAAATALASPAFLFLGAWRANSLWFQPQRLSVLLRYGEGPHISALALLPLALGASFYALRGGRAALIAVAAMLSAAVALTNFYGATSLAILFAILVWSVWITHRDPRVWLRAAAIGALAYGLTAFWLVPSYLRITLVNLSIVSAAGSAASAWAGLAIVVVFAGVSWALARGRKERAYLMFVCGAAFVYTAIVAGEYFWKIRIVGNPPRFVPELDMVLILAAVEAVRRSRALVIPSIAVLLFGAHQYLRHAWEIYPGDPNYRERVEFRTADWIATNLPGSRVFVAGSIRFWYDAWHDLPQPDGGSDQGIINPRAMHLRWNATQAPDPRTGVLWLTAFGVDAIVAPDNTSGEIYHDFRDPRNYASALPVLHDDGKGVVIYRVPRRFPALARVVDRARAEALTGELQPYVDVLESGPDSPVEMSWEGTDAFRMRARVAEGECLIAQVTYDPAWRAYAGGRPVEVRKDAWGQMLVYPPPGTNEVRMVFERPLENTVGWIVTWVSLGLAAALMLGGAGPRPAAGSQPARLWPARGPAADEGVRPTWRASL